MPGPVLLDDLSRKLGSRRRGGDLEQQTTVGRNNGSWIRGCWPCWPAGSARRAECVAAWQRSGPARPHSVSGTGSPADRDASRIALSVSVVQSDATAPCNKERLSLSNPRISWHTACPGYLVLEGDRTLLHGGMIESLPLDDTVLLRKAWSLEDSTSARLVLVKAPALNKARCFLEPT